MCGARYLTSEQVCVNYGISRRALQKYRDERPIPYTSIAGKILYPLSEIERILQTNYKVREESGASSLHPDNGSVHVIADSFPTLSL